MKVLSLLIILFTSLCSSVHAAEELAVYDDPTHRIYIKYPKTWYVRVEDTQNVHHVFISREPIINSTDLFKVGFTVYQFQDAVKTMNLDFSSPAKAAQQWLTANLESINGEKKLLKTEDIQINGQKAYYAEYFSRPVGAPHLIHMIMLTRFYLTTFSVIMLESPEEEFSSIEKIYQEIITDKDFKF